MSLVETSAGLAIQTITSGTTPNDVATYPMLSAPSVTFSIAGTFSGTITFEATLDNQTWYAIGAIKLSDGTTTSTTTTTGLFAITNTGFSSVRARCSTYSSGNITVMLGRGLW